MIIQCPYCGRHFNLESCPPKIFRCPKCSYKAPFSEVVVKEEPQVSQEADNDSHKTYIDEQKESQTQPTTVDSGKTKVVEGLTGTMKTKLVPGLQKKTRGVVSVTFQGMKCGTIALPYSNLYTLGRKSSDGKAQIKITPDITMSRVHAGMRTVKNTIGQVVYQITSLKNENPVYVNGVPVPKGKPCTLKSGDVIKMGATTLIFQLI